MRAELLLVEIRTEFPGFSIREKAQSPLCRILDVFLRGLTLNLQSRFLTEYHTLLGKRLYVAPTWHHMDDDQRTILLRHERVHLQQRRRLGFFGFAGVYLFIFLPMGLAWGRARLEWEAYRETLRATAEIHGPDALLNPRLRAWVVKRFVGPDYGWMWPFPSVVARWYDEAVRDLSNPNQGT